MEKIYIRKTSCLILLIVTLFFAFMTIFLPIFFLFFKKDSFSAITSFIFMLLFSLLFLTIYFIERNGKIVLKNDSITFYYHILIKPRKKIKGGFTVYFKDVEKYRNECFIGDGIISADTNWYIFELNDGTIIRFTLFHFGKKMEIEIKNSLNKLLN